MAFFVGAAGGVKRRAALGTSRTFLTESVTMVAVAVIPGFSNPSGLATDSSAV